MCLHTFAVFISTTPTNFYVSRRTFLRLSCPPTSYAIVTCRTAFQPPTSPMRFFALQRLQPGRSTSSRVLPSRFVPSSGFGHPLDGFLPVRPRRPCFRSAALLGLALQRLLALAVGRCFHNPEPTRGLNPVRLPVQARLSGGFRHLSAFAPQVRPSHDLGLLPRDRLAPLLGFSLSEVCSSTGLAGISTCLRPLAFPSPGHPGFRFATRRIHRRYDHSNPLFRRP
jgi:hypothetical protein